MSTQSGRRISATLLGVVALLSARVAFPQNGYQLTPLVSNVPGKARLTDPALLNAWGLTFGPGGALWVALNHDGTLGAFTKSGMPIGNNVTVPLPGGRPGGSPTGLVFNDSDGFLISNGLMRLPSRLLTVTEDGAIVGFNPALDSTQAFVAVDRSATGAVYKGLALARGRFNAVGRVPDVSVGPASRHLLFAANFFAGQVEVFDSSFRMLGHFTDPSIPREFAPFNVVNIGNQLFVTYAKQLLPDKMDDEPGPGNGYVVVFNTSGQVLRRFASQGALNSPWGLAFVPKGFGDASGTVLIGNFGDGAINSYDFSTGGFVGPLKDDSGNAIMVEGLWALMFDQPPSVFAFDLGDSLNPTGTVARNLSSRGSEPGTADGPSIPGAPDFSAPVSLFITAGPNDENDGLLARINPTP